MKKRQKAGGVFRFWMVKVVPLEKPLSSVIEQIREAA